MEQQLKYSKMGKSVISIKTRIETWLVVIVAMKMMTVKV